MLNDNDIATLRSFTNAGDRISYYQYLIEKGDRYAALAQGVVTNSNLFQIPRHDVPSHHYRELRGAAMQMWSEIAHLQAA